MDYKKLGIAVGLFATVGVTGLAIMYRKEIIGTIQGKKIVRNRAVEKAKKELKHWDNGKIKKHDERTLDRLDDYWKSVGMS